MPTFLRDVGIVFPIRFYRGQTTWTLRPMRRLRLISLRPLAVRIRARNPDLRARLRLELL